MEPRWTPWLAATEWGPAGERARVAGRKAVAAAIVRTDFAI
jgi:hypothetical protein